jgi:phenylalanyl-tRNA synthetase alpha chain
MLNLVELGTSEGEGAARLEQLAALVMSAAGVGDYRIVHTESEVYGAMADVEVNGAEVCSAAVGPNPLDGNWGIVEPWVGLGFGLERLIMVREGYTSIERAGRSVTHVGGVPLTI